MRKGQSRQAQAWAKVTVEGLTEVILNRIEKADGDYLAALPMKVNLPVCTPGLGTRMCQEVNLAKKQFDEAEEGKKQASIAATQMYQEKEKGGMRVDIYHPKLINWVLKCRPIENNMMELWAEQPTGRKKTKGNLLGIAFAMLDGYEQERPKKEAKFNPLVQFLQEKMDAPVYDPQEDVLAQFMAETKKEGEK